MTIDLSELVADLQTEVNPPGSNLFPNAVEAEWVSNLRNGFWEAVLDGIIVGYEETDGIVVPTSGTTNLSREMQQVVIFYAGMRVVKSKFMDIKTVFKASSGPVSYETQQSAQVLKAMLDDLILKRNVWLKRLSDIGSTDSYVIDSIIARDTSIAYADSYWVK